MMITILYVCHYNLSVCLSFCLFFLSVCLTAGVLVCLCLSVSYDNLLVCVSVYLSVFHYKIARYQNIGITASFTVKNLLNKVVKLAFLFLKGWTWLTSSTNFILLWNTPTCIKHTDY